MRIPRPVAASVVMLALVGVGCTAGGGEEPAATVNPSGSSEPVTIEMWTPWTGREYRQWRTIFDGFEKQYPWITVKTVPGVEDQKLLAAINSGTPPDAVESFTTDNIGKFCSSGAFVDLQPYIEQDGLDLEQFTPASLEYTSFEGTRCALPFMSDVWGLYYNADLLRKAGIRPPQTIEELTAATKKLTEFNPDGSIAVAGFVPWFGYYENSALDMGQAWGASWYDSSGASALASDPRWAEMLRWQKSLVDWYGPDRLAEFVAGQGNEFTAANDFQRGRVAMAIDGEWRVAFIDDGAPDLDYGTAPFPTADPALFGSGSIGGDLLGIPRGSPNPAEAWLLIKYMATSTDALTFIANEIRNVPTTIASLESPDLEAPSQFETFLTIAQNPGSTFKEATLVGSADQDLFSAFLERWQAGRVSDLEAGLTQVAQQIDDQIAQAGG